MYIDNIRFRYEMVLRWGGAFETLLVAFAATLEKPMQNSISNLIHSPRWAIRRPRFAFVDPVDMAFNWVETAWQRCQHATLDDRMLGDIAIGHADVERKTSRSFWDVSRTPGAADAQGSIQTYIGRSALFEIPWIATPCSHELPISPLLLLPSC